MPKIDDYVQLAAQTSREIAADAENWRSFLQTASTVYKYGFYDQLMIYVPSARMRPPARPMNCGRTPCGAMSGAAQKVSRCWI